MWKRWRSLRVTQETSDICLFFAEDSSHQHSVMVLAWVTPRWRLLPVAAGIDHPVISPESSHRPTETTALLLLMLCLTFMSAITFMTMSVTSCFILEFPVSLAFLMRWLATECSGSWAVLISVYLLFAALHPAAAEGLKCIAYHFQLLAHLR